MTKTRKVILTVAVATLVLGFSLAAIPSTLQGTVWFVPDEEEAPCVEVKVYTDDDCEEWSFLGSTTTDSCGWYSIGGIAAPCTVWVTVIFDANVNCVTGGWTGTCPSTTLDCNPVYFPDQPVLNKDWDLGLDDCDNVGCE